MENFRRMKQQKRHTSAVLVPAPVTAEHPLAATPLPSERSTSPIQAKRRQVADTGWSFAQLPISRYDRQDGQQAKGISEGPTQLKAQGEKPLTGSAEPTHQQENRTGLPDQLKAGVEHLSGFSLDGVQVHYNSSRPSQMNALAYTRGTQIHVGPGQEKHLAHEAWHVVQQKQGRVKPTLQLKGVSINDNKALEREADIMGTKALHTSGTTRSQHDEGMWTETHTSKETASPAQLQEATGSGNVIQRAIGLEIEIPVPIDRLTNAQVNQINHYVTQSRDPALTQREQADLRVQARIIKERHGRVPYGTIRPSVNGFHLDADHDNRVNPPLAEWPFLEGGNDSILEIVMEPAIDVNTFNTTMNNIATLVQNINAQTQDLTTRWAIPGTANISAGPMDYTAIGLPPTARPARYGFEGSIQVNIGIDPREYHSLIKWYGKSDYAKDNSEHGRALYHQIRNDISTAVNVGRSITKNISRGMTSTDLQQAGNLRGLRGWITHLAFYLRRGLIPRGQLGGSGKNVAPVLLKSPNQIFSNYGMTPEERNYFTNNRAEIMNQILQKVERGNDRNRALNLIDVFASEERGSFSAATLTDLQGTADDVALTGGPIDDPTGVGPQRTGNAAVQGLPPVAAPHVGGGPHTRGGVVLEFRTLPGLYDGVDQWRALGLAFLRAAQERNTRNGIASK